MMRAALALLFLVVCMPAGGQELPQGAVTLLPVLRDELGSQWPSAPLKSAFAAQVEQETCISLKSKGCWNPRTELKTSREYGFGLGQLTITSRFNAWEEVKGMDKDLRSWKWEDRYDPRLQLRAMVVKDRYNYERFPDVPGRQAFMFASYNGGLGGTLSDIKMCRATQGCNPALWFDHVEHTSLKAKTKVKGYGQSFFDINREYVRNILMVRRGKYIQPMGE